MKFQSVAYVASTLPIEILKNNIKNWNLDELIIANDFHFKTYNYLLKNNDVKITIVPKGFFKNFIFLFLKILSIKYRQAIVILISVHTVQVHQQKEELF